MATIPSSYHIETGAVGTSTRVDDIIAMRFVEQGVILDGKDGIAAFVPYGSFRYIKDLGPRGQPATGKSTGPTVTLTNPAFVHPNLKCRCRD